ncbi:MAG: Do family serine endopeptidase [Alphaproteobacteria bacterium]
MRRFILALATFSLSFSNGYAAEMPASFADMLAPKMAAVVNISTLQKIKTSGVPLGFENLPNDPQLAPFKDFFEQFQREMERRGGGPREREATSLGSGFVIDPTGFVVTNYHVVAQADAVWVIFSDNTKLKAKIIGMDAKTDLALLKVEPTKPVTYVSFGNSDALRVGDWVVAVGNPFGLGGSVSAGIVSARGRNINAGPFDDFIQTDAAINRGNSGGPLFNAGGEVVGINSAIFTPTGGSVGIGFAVPSALAEPVITQLKTNGKLHRGWLGVKVQEVTEEVANSMDLGKPRGALVLEITPNGPAQGSGILPGDVVVRFNGKPIDEMRNLPRMVAETKVGTKAELTVWRQGNEKTFAITLGELPDDSKPVKKPALQDEKGAPLAPEKLQRGMVLEPLTPQVRLSNAIPENINGLLVVGVSDDSAAAARGIRPGDVLAEANQRPLTSRVAFDKVFEDAAREKRGYVLLRVVRQGEAGFVTLPVVK